MSNKQYLPFRRKKGQDIPCKVAITSYKWYSLPRVPETKFSHESIFKQGRFEKKSAIPKDVGMFCEIEFAEANLNTWMMVSQNSRP